MRYLNLLIIIILLSSIILFLKKILKFKGETFDGIDNLKVMNQLSDNEEKKHIFDSIDKSLEGASGQQSNIAVSNAKINENLLNLYINSVINEDKGNPNPLLLSKGNELPQSKNNSDYIHDIQVMINSKKIKQDYLIKMLKSKLMVLKNQLIII